MHLQSTCPWCFSDFQSFSSKHVYGTHLANGIVTSFAVHELGAHFNVRLTDIALLGWRRNQNCENNPVCFIGVPPNCNMYGEVRIRTRHMQLALKNMLHTHVHEHMLRSLAKARKLRQPLQRPSHALLGTGFCLQGSNPGLSSLEEWTTLWESSCTAPLHFGYPFRVRLC